MKSQRLWILGLVVTALAPFATGCAEEEAEGREAAYPPGVSAPPPAPPSSQPPLVAPPAPVAEAPAGSEEVAVGTEDDGEAQADAVADTDSSALTDFHAALDPYGNWAEDPTYGTVWVPSASEVGPDFTPYQTSGHWTYDDDYVWVSDYEWGWAPFHYGRWVYGAGMGWEWIPGRRYAGAWVSWRYGWDDWAYVGWAPLAPTWCWRRGIAVGIGFVPAAPYGFVATTDLFAPRIGARIVVGERAGVIGAHTRPWMSGSAGGALAGRAIAHASVGGPPPSTLRIPQSEVTHPGANRGVMQARTFAQPHGAVLAAAHSSYGPATGSAQAAARGSASLQTGQVGARATAPAYGPPAPSHFGGRFGGGFTGHAPLYAAPSEGARPSFSRSPGFSAPAPATRSFSSSPAPSFHAGNPATSSPGAPAFHGFTGGGSTGGFHGGGGYSGGFHGGGGGGGFHSSGGGGGSHGGGGHGGGHR